MSSNWWASKLGNNTEETKSSVPPTTPNYVLPAFRNPTPQQTTTTPNSQIDPNGQIDMATAVRSWKGGEAHRIDGHLSCPRCGSKNVFSRANASAGGKVPAPRCFECGWNNMYEQADQVSWAV